MSTAIVYWSASGNTEAMADAFVAAIEGAKKIEVGSFSADKVAEYDAFAFGCPAMGAEELEVAEFEPVWDECVPEFGEKPVVLFGSYGWGTGEWMETWKTSATDAGVKVVATVIANGEPDDEAIAKINEAAAALA
jgi:flavodoxin short chain